MQDWVRVNASQVELQYKVCLLTLLSRAVSSEQNTTDIYLCLAGWGRADRRLYGSHILIVLQVAELLSTRDSMQQSSSEFGHWNRRVECSSVLGTIHRLLG